MDIFDGSGLWTNTSGGVAPPPAPPQPTPSGGPSRKRLTTRQWLATQLDRSPPYNVPYRPGQPGVPSLRLLLEEEEEWLWFLGGN